VRFAIELMGARPRKAPAGKVSENFVWRGCKAGKKIWGNLQICPNIGGFVRSKHENWGKIGKLLTFLGTPIIHQIIDCLSGHEKQHSHHISPRIRKLDLSYEHLPPGLL
jgi:hypothetical protein